MTVRIDLFRVNLPAQARTLYEKFLAFALCVLHCFCVAICALNKFYNLKNQVACRPFWQSEKLVFCCLFLALRRFVKSAVWLSFGYAGSACIDV